jgi:hypothetical protein
MSAIRRRLASCALALTVLQLSLLFTAPLSACCAPNAGHATKAAADTGDCCPAGSHPPGQCPLHKAPAKNGTSGTSTPASGSPCRMLCDAPHGPQLLMSAVGVLASPDVATVPRQTTSLLRPRPVPLHARPSTPDAPPPELL